MIPSLGEEHAPAVVGWEQKGRESAECWRVVSRGPSSRRFIYETEHHNGIAELLEILGR